MPSRVPQNGRQPVGDMTRNPSHALIPPKVSIASAPPVNITGAAPDRTIPNASPIAWLALAQAVDTLNTGPRSPCAIDTWLACDECIRRGTVNGCTRGLLSA